MKSNQLMDQIYELSLSDRIALVEEIWDSIAIDQQDIPLRESQKNELHRRYEEYLSGQTVLHHLEEVHEKLRKT